ncbi:hypothetical protein IWW38_005922, partial [Coemansia aciculifera]
MSSGERLAKLLAPETESKELAIVAGNDDSNTTAAIGSSDFKDKSRQRGFGVGYKPAAAVGFQVQVDMVVEVASKEASSVVDRLDDLQKTLLAMEELVHDTRYADELVHESAGAAASLLRLGDAQGSKPWPPTIRQLASVVLGTALQNNPAAQSRLFAAGTLPQFISNVVHEYDARALGKHIFALSALVRGNNQALAEFGGDALRNLRGLLFQGDSNKTVVGDRKVRDMAEVRVVRLVEDVLNSELHPDWSELEDGVKAVFAESASVWCTELAERLGKEL